MAELLAKGFVLSVGAAVIAGALFAPWPVNAITAGLIWAFWAAAVFYTKPEVK